MPGMLEIKSFVFGPFQTNTYVVNTCECVYIIDPACYSQYEQQMLYAHVKSLFSGDIQADKLRIIATHGHLDHLWGAPWVCEQWNGPVWIHPADIPMAKDMQGQYDLFGISKTAEPFPIQAFNPSDPALKGIEIIETPGHTPGSICLYWPEEKVLFSGDTLFQMGYGRTDLPGGSTSQLIQSLERLFELPEDVRVYPGHGGFTTIAAEKR